MAGKWVKRGGGGKASRVKADGEVRRSQAVRTYGAGSLMDLLDRSAHEADGRSNILALSDQGRELHTEIAPLALAYEAALIAGLTPAEVETLKRLLSRLETAATRLSGEEAPG